MESHWPHRTAKRSLFSLAVSNGGSICLWYLYVYICTGSFLYFLISWLFQMGSHWPHWTVKRLLCALAVSNGGRTSAKEGSSVIFLSVNCFKWVLIDGMDTHRVNSFSLAVLCGGRGHLQTNLHLQILSSFLVLLLLHRALSFLIRNERPIRIFTD